MDDGDGRNHHHERRGEQRRNAPAAYRACSQGPRRHGTRWFRPGPVTMLDDGRHGFHRSDRGGRLHTVRSSTIEGGASLPPIRGPEPLRPAGGICHLGPMKRRSVLGDLRRRRADPAQLRDQDPRSARRPALADVSLDVAAGEVVAVMDRRAAGSPRCSTSSPDWTGPPRGTVPWRGGAIDTLGESALARFRARHVGIIFAVFNLLDNLTVENNVLLPAQLAGASRQQARAHARDLLDRMGVEEHRDAALPARLSGGQRQRVAIAQGAGERELLLADERDRALDTTTRRSAGCCGRAATSAGRRWCWSPMIQALAGVRPARCGSSTGSVSAARASTGGGRA